MAKDSTLYLNASGRFQSLMVNTWDINANDSDGLSNLETNILIRRARLKFKGWAVNPSFKYNVELALSNRDNGGGNSSRFNNAANIILTAQAEWNFYKGLSIWFGQGKLPGNRERIISSGNLQFVDRSRLNSRFTLDRDVGVMLKHNHKFGNKFILRETFALSSGEGKNITAINEGGRAYTFKVEALPFGKFASKGDYSGGDLAREELPKLAIAVAYDINVDAGRTRGQGGSFLSDISEFSIAKNLSTVFADLIFNYQGFSVMVEYVNRTTDDGDSSIFGENNEVLANYFTGSATNVAVGYLFRKNWEVAARFTNVLPDENVASNENQYTLGLSKYIVGHKLKVQTDVTYRDLDIGTDTFIYRLQVDIHL